MALPTLDATFASAADLPRRQMLAKWLVEELGETGGNSSVLVSGAGSEEANGTYTYRGEDGGKPYYNLVGEPDNTNIKSIVWGENIEWRIYDDGAEGIIYTSTDDVEFPWLATFSLVGGIDPVPTVTETPQPSPISNYYDLPERYLWAKIAVAAGGLKTEADYISLPKNYVWSDIYNAVAGSSGNHTDWSENVALGHIAAAYRGDTGNPANLATYIDWPWRYQVASIIVHTSIDSDVLAFVAASGATDVAGLDAFVKGVKDLGLWDSMVCWPLRSSQNSGGADPTNTTVYSLGGLGTYNGTRVNGTVWDSVGLDFDGINDRVTLPNGSFGTGNAATSIWAFLKNDTTASQMVVLSQGNNGVGTDSFSLQSRSPSGSDAAVVALTLSVINVASTSWKSLFMGNTTAGFRGKDGGTVTQFSLSNVLNKTGNSCAIGSFGNHPILTAPFDGKIAAVIRINATPTTQLNGNIHSLYKNTLGTGLGLP